VHHTGHDGANADFHDDDDVYPGVIISLACPLKWPTVGNEFIIVGIIAKGTTLTLEVLGSMRIILFHALAFVLSCPATPWNACAL
jgi:hypothetical protein